MNLPEAWIHATVAAIEPLADPENARAMRSYMKDVAPFLGLKTEARRSALRSAWQDLPRPGALDVPAIVLGLWALSEREYQYAACDLIAREQRRLPASFLASPVQDLLTTKPWWDTVDSLGSGAISPLTARHPDTVGLMWQWWDSGDRWLVRAALQHQRGRKEDTDLDVLFTMCDRYAADREFFVAKAIGWALRDVTAWDPGAVQRFVDDHPALSAVARREATRGLARSSRP
jgi:3-methyladenine DNA glycosylase AlkD